MNTTDPIKILHLEDSPRDAEIIESKLSAAGLACAITVVADEPAYIGALAAETWDIILCDYNLADYDGISALTLARQLHPLTPVMLISGILGEEEAVKCLQTGATDYLLKQKLERLPAAVTRALDEAEVQRQRKLTEDHNHEPALLLDKAQDAIYVRDLDQRITYWNLGAERLYGWSAEEVLGKRAVEVLYKKETPDLLAIREMVMTTGEWVGELKQRTKEGKEVTVMGRRNLLRSEAGEPISILNINTDITEKKRLEAELNRTQRLQSIISLAGGVAQDLKNALGPILMAAEMLKLRHPEDNDLVGMVSVNAMRGADMARQLMIFARGVEGARLVVPTQGQLDQIQNTIWDTFPTNINLITRFQENLPPVLGDATQLQQVLHHLCANARDAMPQGGCLTLEAEAVSVDAEYAGTISHARPGSYVLWSITDTGCGIAPEVRERIFEPFFSTKKAGKRTGFGLSTIMGVVKSHGGFIQVYSTPHEGSTFAVYLPADCEAGLAEIAAPAPLPAPIQHAQGELVLVVDRDVTRRQSARTALTSLGLEVLAAADVTEAIVQIIQTGDRRGNLRTVITDLHMPHMNGFAFLQVIKRMLPFAEIIASSTPQDEAEAENFRAFGVYALPGRQSGEHELVQTLQEVLEKRRAKPLLKKGPLPEEIFEQNSRTAAATPAGLGLRA
ncbi:MAG: response regulator [Prosthecobacter sp.]